MATAKKTVKTETSAKASIKAPIAVVSKRAMAKLPPRKGPSDAQIREFNLRMAEKRDALLKKKTIVASLWQIELVPVLKNRPIEDKASPGVYFKAPPKQGAADMRTTSNRKEAACWLSQGTAQGVARQLGAPATSEWRAVDYAAEAKLATQG